MNRAEAIEILTAAGEPYELTEVVAQGKRVKWFANGPATIPQIFRETLCDQIFYVYQDEKYTFNEVYHRAASLARKLVEEFDVKPGDRVAIALRNYPEWPIAFTAISSIGAVAVAINAWWQMDELEYGLLQTGTKVVIADQERLDRIIVSDKLQHLNVISVRSEPTSRATPISSVFTENVEMPMAKIESDDDALILFTSGSTDRPKGAVSTHRNIISSLLSWELDLKCMFLMREAIGQPLPVNKRSYQDATLLGMPLFHVNGLLAVLLSSYRRYRKTVAMYKWDPAVAAELIEKEKIASFVGTPAMTGDLTEEGKKSNRDFSSLRVVGGGGAARAVSQVKDISKTFKATPNTAWGMTETNSIGTSIIGKDYLAKPSSSGVCSAVLELAIVDEERNFLPPNERGELLVRGTSVIQKYWDRPAATKASFFGDWFCTGDIAYLDEDGYLFIVDRLKQIIIRGGENIGCAEVESALLDDTNIVEASVYGIPDDRLGEEVGATVYAQQPVQFDTIKTVLMTKIAKFKIPKSVVFAEQPLPRIASGKIDKRKIQQAHLKKLSR